jgi:undecaprenyl-diphosphatase
MTLLAAIVLGLIQGLTEFLPVSSDGHLALGGFLFGLDPAGDSGVFFDLVLHVATMLAVLIHFRREIVSLLDAFKDGEKAAVARKTIGLVVLGTIATGIVALPLKHACESAFGVMPLVGLGFLGTSAVLFATLALLRRRSRTTEDPALPDWSDVARIRYRDAIVVGALQGLAPWPGLSRSAITIFGGVAMGIPPQTAARFSLLVSLPAIGGAFLLELRHVHAVPEGVGAMACGFVVAGVVGYVAIGWLIAIARKARLAPFAVYTALLGFLTIVLAATR